MYGGRFTRQRQRTVVLQKDIFLRELLTLGVFVHSVDTVVFSVAERYFAQKCLQSMWKACSTILFVRRVNL